MIFISRNSCFLLIVFVLFGQFDGIVRCSDGASGIRGLIELQEAIKIQDIQINDTSTHTPILAPKSAPSGEHTPSEADSNILHEPLVNNISDTSDSLSSSSDDDENHGIERQSGRNKWKNVCCSQCSNRASDFVQRNQCYAYCKKLGCQGSLNCQATAENTYYRWCQENCKQGSIPRLPAVILPSCGEKCGKQVAKMCRNKCQELGCNNINININICINQAPKSC